MMLNEFYCLVLQISRRKKTTVTNTIRSHSEKPDFTAASYHLSQSPALKSLRSRILFKIRHQNWYILAQLILISWQIGDVTKMS